MEAGNEANGSPLPLQTESDDGRHDYLLSTIAALKGKDRKQRVGYRSEATPTASEYHLPQQEDAGELFYGSGYP